MYSEAIQCYDSMLAIEPDSIDTLRGKGKALLWLHDYSNTMECLDTALGFNHGNADVLCDKALILYHANNLKYALSYCDKAIDIDSASVRIWMLKGDIQSAPGEYRKSIECFDRVSLLDRGNKSADVAKKLAQLSCNEMIQKNILS